MENENVDILTVPVLPLRGLVVFPGSILHFDVARKRSVAALTAAMEKYNQKILITAQRDSSENEPQPDDFYEMGQESVDRAGFEMMHEKILDRLHPHVSYDNISVVR